MKPQLICIDLDGTLLDEEKEIRPAVQRTVLEAKNTGAKIVLCSGRPFSGVAPYLEKLGLNGEEDYAITYNGAVIQNAKSKKTISSFPLTYDDYLNLEMTGRKLACPVHIHLLDPARIVTHNRHISPYTVTEAYQTNSPLYWVPQEEVTADSTIVKVMFINDPAKLDQVIAAIPPVFHEKYTCVRSETFFYEFISKKASKGIALIELARYLKIPIEATMAIGDQGNDLSMVQAAGCGIAMGNAITEVKAAAQFITASNEEDGVAKALRKFILN